ncbi:hypothetical protein E5288_WYG018242 [Bos mutus]|uniref:Uncharacterized protein n=1 Tax=Bos mutus TaxID=72004 RepID=A0A6B0S1A5_9CETA|nr:hypothetical protein [Bos mutus]
MTQSELLLCTTQGVTDMGEHELRKHPRASLQLGVAPGPDPAVERQQGVLGAPPITCVIRGVRPPVLLFTFVLCKPVHSKTATYVSVDPHEMLESWYHLPSLEDKLQAPPCLALTSDGLVSCVRSPPPCLALTSDGLVSCVRSPSP